MGWFGPSKDDMWRQLSQEIGAEFIEGGFWKGNKVQAHVGIWTITLDVYTESTGETHVTETRLWRSERSRPLPPSVGVSSHLGYPARPLHVDPEPLTLKDEPADWPLSVNVLLRVPNLLPLAGVIEAMNDARKGWTSNLIS